MNQAAAHDIQPESIDETDWETVFESPVHGFITVVEQAQSVKILKQCADLIINNLFTRKGDAAFRAAYHDALNRYLSTPGSDDVDLSDGKEFIVALLRDIKKHRQLKSAKYVAEATMAAKNSANDDRNLSATKPEQPEKRGSKPPSTIPGLTQPPPEPSTAECVDGSVDDLLVVFADVFCNALDERLKALYLPTEQTRKAGDKLPFILSEDFATHFESIVRLHFIPAILKSSRSLTKMLHEQPENTRREFLIQYSESRNGRQFLWEKWQDNWKNLTQQKTLPQKPKRKPKKSLISALSLKKEKKLPAWKREKTPEEWQANVAEMKLTNKAAAAIWSEISTNTSNWLPPQESDNKLLMDLFARSVNGLQKQNSGLCQIVQQGDNVARLLTNFARGKDIDLALLAACYQKPHLFYLKNSALKEMMAGYTQKIVDQDFPMVSRYLSKHF